VGSNHHLSELSVDSFENFGVFGQLLPDIFRSHEDVDQDSPVLLHFEPFVDHYVHSSQFLSPALHGGDEILDVLALRLHSHQIEGVGVQDLHHVVEGGEDEVLFVVIEGEDLFGPVALDDFKFFINFELFLGDIDDLFHLGLQFVQLESQNVIEAESGSLVVEFCPCLVLQLLPMSVLHVVSSQTLHQVEHDGHVSHLLAQRLPPLDESHLFVH